MKFVLELWPDEGDGPLTPAQLVKEAIESVRLNGEHLAWDVLTDDDELIAEVTPDDLSRLARVLVWESAGNDEPRDQNASTQLVPHGFWSLGPAGPDEAGLDRGWGVELIEQDELLEEISGGGVHLGHFDSEDAAKQAADDYEREHRARRKVFVVPISIHVEAFSAEGAVTKVWENINDAAGATITTSDGSEFQVIRINTPRDAKEGAAPASYGYDLLDGDGMVPDYDPAGERGPMAPPAPQHEGQPPHAFPAAIARETTCTACGDDVEYTGTDEPEDPRDVSGIWSHVDTGDYFCAR